MNWGFLKRWASRRYGGRNKAKFIVPKLLLSAAVYFVWAERNKHCFKEQHTPASTVEEDIFQIIRLHLYSSKIMEKLPPEHQARWGGPF